MLLWLDLNEFKYDDVVTRLKWVIYKFVQLGEFDEFGVEHLCKQYLNRKVE